MELDEKIVDLSETAAQIVKALALTAPGADVRVVIEPGILVFGDPFLLHLLLENLLSNAWKYTGKVANPTIEVGINQRQDKWITIFIRDNGCGFDSTAPKLFEPFQHFHAEKEFPGTGVGLSSAQRIVRRYGGSLSADSKPGEGATFLFTLPDRLPASG